VVERIVKKKKFPIPVSFGDHKNFVRERVKTQIKEMFPSDLAVVILEYLFPKCTETADAVLHGCNCCKQYTSSSTSLSYIIRHGIFESRLSSNFNICPPLIHNYTKRCVCSKKIVFFETIVNLNCSKAEAGQQFRDHFVSHNRYPVPLRVFRNSIRSYVSLHNKYCEIKRLLSFLDS
jgi:hypothetical protein